MSITLTLSPEQEADLERRALAAGTDVTRFILDVVQERLEERSGCLANEASYDQWSEAFHPWIASQRSRNPHFDDSRESIYD